MIIVLVAPQIQELEKHVLAKKVIEMLELLNAYHVD
jgi:hypothetical protein